MNRLIFVLAISLAVASSIAGKANATVYTETITVDAKTMSITHTTSPFLTNGFLQFTVPVVNLQPGDQYDLTVRFLPSQSITVTNCLPGPHCTSVLTFGDEASLPSTANSPTDVTLLSAHGDGFTNELGSCGDCFYGGINPLLDPSTLSSLTFRGVEFIGTATLAFSTSGTESLGISVGGTVAGDITIKVPEPSTLLIFLTGLAGVWIANPCRRRTAQEV